MVTLLQPGLSRSPVHPLFLGLLIRGATSADGQQPGLLPGPQSILGRGSYGNNSRES